MKQKILNQINDFVNLCYTAFAISAGDFAKENFQNLVENIWDEKKTDNENLKEVKDLFELNRHLNEKAGNPFAAKTIATFQEGWLNKI